MRKQNSERVLHCFDRIFFTLIPRQNFISPDSAAEFFSPDSEFAQVLNFENEIMIQRNNQTKMSGTLY